ncbi:hypothetical protein N8668_02130 [bacterium]|nr:hypothetical protein [bacterium]
MKSNTEYNIEMDHLETADEFLTRAAIEFNEQWNQAHSNAQLWQDAGAIVISSSAQIESAVRTVLQGTA